MEVAEREKPLLKDLNEHIMCQLCRGYLIDATTLVECLHSFCRGCIVRLYSGARACPVCGVKTTPPLLPDTRLQRLVYLVVPGLFRSELQRRRHFLVMNPLCPPLPPPLGAINLTLDDFVSLSLEELDETEWEVGENKVLKKRSVVLSECRSWNDNGVNDETSQDGGKTSSGAARYLKCPAAVTVRHLVRLLMLKRGWGETNSSTVNGVSKIEIMYRHFGSLCRSEEEEIHLLSPFWTLLDLAYIFHWNRIEPMKLVYRVLRKEEMLSISEVPSNYVAEDNQPAIENIQRPPTPPPSPKPSREPEAEVEVEVRQTLENDTNLPRNLETSADRDKETKTKKPRCEVTPVMRTPDPPANLSTRNHHHHHHHHHSKESTRSKHMGRVEHRKRRKRRNKRVIAEITTTPREDLLKLKVRLTPRPPRITSNGGGNSSGESGRSKDRLSHLRAVRREKLKALSQQHSTAARSPRAISPPSDHSPVHSSETGEEASAKEGCVIETEETIEDIIDSIPDEVVRIAQSEDSTVIERVVTKDVAKEKLEPVKEGGKVKEAKEMKDAKEAKEIKQTKEAKEMKEAKKTQNVKETKEAKEMKRLKEIEEIEEVEVVEEVIEVREVKETKKIKEAKEVKETRELGSESESPKKDQEILRRLGLVAVNEAIAELRDKAKQRSQYSADKTNSLDREKLERQLRESKANRVRSLLAEKQMRDALKSIMSKTNEERSCVSSTPSSVPATAPATASVTTPTTIPTTTPVSSFAAALSAVSATTSTTARGAAPSSVLFAALTAPATVSIITSATTSTTVSATFSAATSTTTATVTSANILANVPAASPLLTTTPKKKGPPPLAPLRVAKPSGFATTSGMLMSNTPKYETPLDLSSAGTVNNKVLDLSATLTTSSNLPTSSSSSTSTHSSSTTSSPPTKAYPVIISETIIRSPKHLEHRKEQQTSLKEAATSVLGNCSTEKDQVEPLALASTNATAANKVALRIPQPHHRISGFRVKVIKPNLSIRQIPNPQAVVASQYRNQRPNYVNTVSQQPP